MEKQIKNKGVDRNSFLPVNTDVETYHKNIGKIELKFDGEYINLECPDCKTLMKLTPIQIRGWVMDIGVQCPKCKKQRFLVKLRFDRDFDPI